MFLSTWSRRLVRTAAASSSSLATRSRPSNHAPFPLRASSSAAPESPASAPSPPPSSETASAPSLIGPLDLPDFFGVHQLFTVEDLFRARVHLGHRVTATDPRMKPFLFGERFGMGIFDLDQTAQHLRQALNFLAHVASQDGIILFVSRQPQLTQMVERTAIECGEYAHCRKWNRDIFLAPKQTFGGEVRLPDAIVVMHTKEGIRYDSHEAIKDANKALIPTVAIVDSDCNPNIITYPVPGNDDTLESVQLYLHLFKQAIQLGKKYRQEQLVLEKEAEEKD